MNVRDTDWGKTIRTLREVRQMTRFELSEAAGISESHLKKIESGSRRPGIDTYQKIIDVLGVDIVIQDEDETVKGNCAARVQEILMKGLNCPVCRIKTLPVPFQNLSAHI